MTVKSKKPRFFVEQDTDIPLSTQNQFLDSINDDISDVKEGYLSLPVDRILLAYTQQRDKENAKNIDDIFPSIEREGVNQPILVRRSPIDISKFELVAGERRYHCAIKAGLKTIPAVFKNLDDQEKIVAQWSENRRRKNLTVREEIKGILEARTSIAKISGDDPSDYEIGMFLGEDKSWISVRLSIQKSGLDGLLELSKTEKDARKLFELHKLYEIDPVLANGMLGELKEGKLVSRKKVIDTRKEVEGRLGHGSDHVSEMGEGSEGSASDTAPLNRAKSVFDGDGAGSGVGPVPEEGAANAELLKDNQGAKVKKEAVKNEASGASEKGVFISAEFNGRLVTINLSKDLGMDSKDVYLSIEGDRKIVAWSDLVILEVAKIDG